MAHKFFLNDLIYTQTVSLFKTEHIYENYFKTMEQPLAFTQLIKTEVSKQLPIHRDRYDPR